MFLGLCWPALEMGRTKEGEVSRLAAACTFSSPSGKTCTWSMDSCSSSTHAVLCVGETRACLTDSCKSVGRSVLCVGKTCLTDRCKGITHSSLYLGRSMRSCTCIIQPLVQEDLHTVHTQLQRVRRFKPFVHLCSNMQVLSRHPTSMTASRPSLV